MPRWYQVDTSSTEPPFNENSFENPLPTWFVTRLKRGEMGAETSNEAGVGFKKTEKVGENGAFAEDESSGASRKTENNGELGAFTK